MNTRDNNFMSMMNISSCILRPDEPIIDESIQQDSTKQCSICLTRQKLSQFYSFGCPHQFCKRCLIAYIRQSIKDFTPLRCCQEGCQKIIDHSKQSIYHQLTDGNKKMVDLLLDNYDRTVNVRICKHCNIGALIQKIGKQNKQILQCRECHTVSCYNCFKVAHTGRCTNLQTLDYPNNCGQCRKCKSIIEKQAGCNHIKCICGYQFCFECSYHWDSSHICQFKIQRRSGCSKWMCNAFKVVLGLPLAIIVLLFYLFYVLVVCLLSSLILGSMGWLNVLGAQLKSSKIKEVQHSNEQMEANFVNCYLFLIWLIVLPVAILIFAILGFFLPFWNLCHDEKIALSPTILTDLWPSVSSWIDIYLIL